MNQKIVGAICTINMCHYHFESGRYSSSYLLDGAVLFVVVVSKDFAKLHSAKPEQAKCILQSLNLGQGCLKEYRLCLDSTPEEAFEEFKRQFLEVHDKA